MKLILIIFLFISNAEKTEIIIRQMESSTSSAEQSQFRNDFLKAKTGKDVYYYYYPAYSFMKSAIAEKDDDKKEELLIQALNWVNKADSIAPKNSEVKLLTASIYFIRLTISPTAGYFKYKDQITENFDAAYKLNPENPRYYYMKGQWMEGLPSFVGGSKEEACKLYTIASQKFDTYKPANQMEPTWGKTGTLTRKGNCK